MSVNTQLSEGTQKFSRNLLQHYLFTVVPYHEFIHQNMCQALPSLQSVQRIIRSQYKIMDEGTFRFDDLCN